MLAQTSFLKRCNHAEAPEKVGEKDENKQTDPPRTRGGTFPIGSTAQCCQSLPSQVPWMGLGRQASNLAIMPPPPVTPKPGAGGFVHGPIVTKHSLGATTPTANKRVYQPAPRTLEATDRHQAESFQGEANQWQGGTCHRKFRADEWRLPRVSPRQLPQRNRKDLDRLTSAQAHK